MEGSKLGYQTWLLAMILVKTSLKGVSSMKLHRDLGVTQKTAWFLARRISTALPERGALLAGPVEVDETYMSGKRRNMPKSKHKELTGRGALGKTAVMGATDLETNQVAAKVVTSTDKETLQGFVENRAAKDEAVYRDNAGTYQTLPFSHDSVMHSLKQYVKRDVHTNGIESRWPMLKRAHKRTFHKFSPKHVDRYIQGFAGHHNMREQDTVDQRRFMCEGMDSKRLTYKTLIGDNGLASGERGA